MKKRIINGKVYKEHHTSYARGYVSVKNGGEEDPKPYKGWFGKGYTIRSHNPNSTMWCLITYYVEEVNN